MKPDSQKIKYIAMCLLAAAGGILATPLSAGPLVLFALIAAIMMLAMGRGTLQRLGDATMQGRNIFLIAFGGWFCAELISTAINNQYWKNLDYPFRFLLGLGVFWLIRHSLTRRSEIFFYGIAASAAAAAAISLYQHFALGIDRAMGWTHISIYFGNLSVVLCVFAAIVLITMRDKISKQMFAIMVATILLFIVAVFLSGSRSSWLGLLALVVVVDWSRVNYTRMIGGMLILVMGISILFAAVPELSSLLRVTEAIQDVQRIMSGDYSSSIGYRLQMWKAALLMFWSSPLIGIGSHEYQGALENLMARGAIKAGMFQGETIFNQAHSEIMDILASKGILGLVAYLALLILPFRYFRALAETTNAEAKVFALMGQATIIAFVMFGLTLATFKVQIYCAVFPLIIAMFAAMALNLTDTQTSTVEKL